MLLRTLPRLSAPRSHARLLQGRASSIFRRHASSKQAALKAAKPPSSTPNPPALRLKPAAPPPPRSDTRFRKFNFDLSQSSGPVELFKAPSHRSYIFSAYSTAFFCCLFSGYNFWAISIDPIIKPDRWQEYTFGGICVVMSAMGAVFFRRGTNLIASITAARSEGQTRLSIKVRRIIPFLKQREIIATPEQVSFSRKLVVPNPKMTSEEMAATHRRWEAERVVAETPFFKAPLKKVNLGFWRFFRNTRRLFTQEYFVYVTIAGQKAEFRMDGMGTFSPQMFELEKSARGGV
ncbi:predicted protein [Uncinocarpus reesii 1704]|uniref:Uncharacterized protein n=1 Tax=Uncinocarpus reesii (strain UAMH 1704) TaxID=336963 RepID=C4JZS2_UNCRE|nr:uncharacterized protein UREG_07673 [Uncinocarpus reesii 1704]EEP82808.1 predicted protein [Uncinocarpus reesii 1704]